MNGKQFLVPDDNGLEVSVSVEAFHLHRFYDKYALIMERGKFSDREYDVIDNHVIPNIYKDLCRNIPYIDGEEDVAEMYVDTIEAELKGADCSVDQLFFNRREFNDAHSYLINALEALLAQDQ